MLTFSGFYRVYNCDDHSILDFKICSLIYEIFHISLHTYKKTVSPAIVSCSMLLIKRVSDDCIIRISFAVSLAFSGWRSTPWSFKNHTTNSGFSGRKKKTTP